jgi:hypothetical protein
VECTSGSKKEVTGERKLAIRDGDDNNNNNLYVFLLIKLSEE